MKNCFVYKINASFQGVDDFFFNKTSCWWNWQCMKYVQYNNISMSGKKRQKGGADGSE